MSRQFSHGTRANAGSSSPPSGSSKGRLETFAPVSNAAARMANHNPPARRV